MSMDIMRFVEKTFFKLLYNVFKFLKFLLLVSPLSAEPFITRRGIQLNTINFFCENFSNIENNFTRIK